MYYMPIFILEAKYFFLHFIEIFFSFNLLSYTDCLIMFLVHFETHFHYYLVSLVTLPTSNTISLKS